VNTPLIAMTTGDPAGIGPEIIAKTAACAEFSRDRRAFAIGDPDWISKVIAANRLALQVQRLARPEDFVAQEGVLAVYAVGQVPVDLQMGRVDARAGAAAYSYVRSAIELANAGRVDAICTAPINKESLAAAGVQQPGHTEILAELTRSGEVGMMLVTSDLRTILVTIHCSLREAIARLTLEAELRAIRLADQTLRRIGITRPRIAVAGLNPHAGEGGLFGHEDRDIIAPAVRLARGEGIEVSGPLAGDTVFMQARRGAYDIVVAQYHDQGLIPIKLMGIEQGVNLTVGLPFVRTSPDHGTAFDIAGRGIADPSSMRAALSLAHDLSAQHTGR
jgi:4-hydroxythreonine-4-phosphate dehydrogenase